MISINAMLILMGGVIVGYIALFIILMSEFRERNKWREQYVELNEQVHILSTFIMKNIPGEPSRSEGAIETAIRLLSQYYSEEPRLAKYNFPDIPLV